MLNLFIHLKEGRTLNAGDKVECYRNLHKGAFSIRSKKTKLVTAIANGIMIGNVVIKVSESGRQRVIKEGQKNVHAFITGDFISSCVAQPKKLDSEWIEITYNPYRYDGFVRIDTLEKVVIANEVYMYNNKCYMMK